MHSALSLALVLLAAIVPDTSAASAGCGKDPVESGEKTTNVNGKDRQYILQVPSNYNPETPYKLIFGYHWLGGTKDNVAPGYYGLRDIAAESAIFVAPQGLDNGWGNAGGEDITFTDQMIETIQDSLCVDETQIFATGFSYGGAMSYSLACSRADVIRSVAVIAGATLSGCDGGNTPVPYLGIHGVVDSVLNIGMGRELRDKYLQLNGCQAQEAQEPQAGSGTHIKTEYECNPGYPVWWIAHSGDHVGDPRDGNGDYWAPRETWAFWTEAIGGGGNATSS
ncbi:hypothetical protein FQN55_004983 [Onygenales sp. PD_40]|nr:hypothetical protein FQN55_004983 [Onygenales sp. PD_40]KAK2767197.1 hypothetical protein FQN53_006551 [Emmonsiellopsis sp. PD_33]KAK2785048.1 hypothetical protein FQN52_008770 [Onygenales sp. PD_12]KAK2797897.1 hypothetical protein FQN51_008205 [Onygenales sp. PD_10]